MLRRRRVREAIGPHTPLRHDESARLRAPRRAVLDPGARAGHRPHGADLDTLPAADASAAPIAAVPAQAARLRRLQGLGIVSGLAAGVWLGAAEAPTKLV